TARSTGTRRRSGASPDRPERSHPFCLTTGRASRCSRAFSRMVILPSGSSTDRTLPRPRTRLRRSGLSRQAGRRRSRGEFRRGWYWIVPATRAVACLIEAERNPLSTGVGAYHAESGEHVGGVGPKRGSHGYAGCWVLLHIVGVR